ncbi:MAG: LPS export ABC transporter periplasmic protein LptC [Thiotrichales bacterium]|nr:LPS export ABC transporter periplasmic protein LptC [Thiotrichales bacterium]
MRLPSIRLLLSLSAAGALVALNHWLQPDPPLTPNTELAEQSTWQFRDTQLWQPNLKTGGSVQLSAQNIDYQADFRLSQFTQLFWIDYTPERLQILSAPNAELNAQRQLELSGLSQFAYFQPQAQNPIWQPQIQLQGEQFTYNSRQNTLTSDHSIRLTQPFAQTEAGNLAAQLKNGEWRFAQGVQTLAHPQ